MGTPIITRKKIDPDNIIAKNNLGWVAEDYFELPNLIKLMVKSSNFDRLSKRCQEYVKKNHNPIKLAKLFVKELKKL